MTSDATSTVPAPTAGDGHFRLTRHGLISAAHRESGSSAPGAVQEDVVGRNITELVPPEAATTILDAIAECLDTRSVVNVRYSLDLGGGEHHREARLAPDGSDNVVGIVSDVTALHRSDARRVHLAEILEASSDYVATTDLDGRIMYANRAFRDRFGIPTVDDVATTAYNLFDFFSPESRATFLRDALLELWVTGRWTGEIEGIAADGTLVPLSQSAIAHRDSTGHPEYFSGIARDITEMKAAREELAQSEERFRALVAEGSDVILVLSAEGLITYVSPAVERSLGYQVSALIGTSVFDLIHPDDLARGLSAFEDVLHGDGRTVGLQYRVRHLDGSWRWGEANTTNHLDTPGINGFIVNVRDVTSRHEAGERLEQASALLVSVMGAAASEAIFVTDRNATIVAFSRGAEVLLGRRADDVVGILHPSAFHLHDEVAAVAGELGISSEALFLHAPPDGGSIVREWVFVRGDGSTFDGSLTVSARFDSDGALDGFLYVARDVTDRRRRERELTQQAHHDTLTGLSNRTALVAALRVAADDVEWSDPGRILLFIDLDHFKHVNDTLGHAAGDAVLVGVSTRLIDHLRTADLPVRLGGDEFVVLLGNGVSGTIATDIAERIVKALAKPFTIGGVDVLIGASVGVAMSNLAMTPDDLLQSADTAAYAAKHLGRGRVEHAVR